MSKTYTGRYKPKNPKKYKGDPSNIVHRSSWERAYMKRLDLSKQVISWQSEEKCVWYWNPVKKMKCRYFPDFIVERVAPNGEVIKEMIEIKPSSQVKGPTPNPKRRTRSWMNQVQTYATNQAKWKYARKWCEERGMDFVILTEKDCKEFL